MFWDALSALINSPRTADLLDMASTAVSVASNLQQGGAAAKAARYNQNIARYNAGETRKAGVIEENRVRREGQRRLGAMRANAGASGLDGGTIDDLMAESTFNAEFDALATRYNYNSKATGYDMEADLYGSSAKDAKTAGYIGAASALLKGGTSIYARNADYTTGGLFKLGGGSGNYTMYSDGTTIKWDN